LNVSSGVVSIPVQWPCWSHGPLEIPNKMYFQSGLGPGLAGLGSGLQITESSMGPVLESIRSQFGVGVLINTIAGPDNDVQNNLDLVPDPTCAVPIRPI
jgi:hypothetical protein